MGWYPISSLVASLVCFSLAFFVYFKGKGFALNKKFALLTTAIGYCCFSSFIVNTTTSKTIALAWSRILNVGMILIVPISIHFDLAIKRESRKSKAAMVVWFFSIIFLLFSFTPLFIKGVETAKYIGFSFVSGYLYIYFIIFFIIVVCYGFLIIFVEYLHSSGYRRNQLKYFLFALLVAFFGSLTYFLLNERSIISFPPIDNIVVICFVLITSYAIVKHRLMDIRVAVTRTGIFIAVYTIILGFPFAVGAWSKSWLIDTFGVNWWFLPLGLMAALATFGPFIYIFFQRKAEGRLLVEQKRYQNTLKHASMGMTRIRNLRRLLDLITHIITKTVRIIYAAIYLYDEQSGNFLLQVSRDRGRVPVSKVDPENPLVKWILLNHDPLVYEEIKRQEQETNNIRYKVIGENMKILDASVIIPSFLEDKFIGFIVLGEKVSGQIYTADDLNVFQVLASQAALAIENAQFYEEAKEMQEQIAQAEKMATVGTMADGLSHQINNRFYALSLIAGDTVDTIKLTDTSKCTPEVKEMLGDINRALERIRVNVMQGSEVVKGILKYTRKGDEGLESLSMDQVLDGTLDMAQYKVKLHEIDIIRDYPKDVAKIKGNLVQLQEVFFNFIDNAYDAIVERRTTLKEQGYRGKITVSCRQVANHLEIIVADNGMGMKEESVRKIFTPFFTTKISARKGTGLGLYVIKKIITDNHQGKISFESAHKVGTRFILELPAA